MIFWGQADVVLGSKVWEIFLDTLYHSQKWDCLQIYYVLDMVDNDSLGAIFIKIWK